MLNMECFIVLGVEWAIRHENILPRIAQISTDAIRVDILKNTNLTNLTNDH